MQQRSMVEEARKCREWAHELAGQPEQAMLLRIAHAFDDLAGGDMTGGKTPRPVLPQNKWQVP